jgi:polar amino acid transport system substrate-binding protein
MAKHMNKYFTFILLHLIVFNANAQIHINVVTEQWYPYNYHNKSGQVIGRATDKVKTILDKLKLSYTIKSYPWARAMMLAQKNDNTLIYSIFKTPERVDKFQWICPLLPPVKIFLFKLKNRLDLKVNNLEQVKQHTVSINRGDSSHEFLRSVGFKSGINLDVTSNDEISINKLFLNRVDFIVQTEFTANQLLRSLNKPENSLTKVLELKDYSSNAICMAFSLTTDSSLVNKFKNELLKLNHQRK